MLGLSCGRRNESSRKRGRKNNSKGPKQPQRGLGVARLEKIILQNQVRANFISATNIDLHQVFISCLQVHLINILFSVHLDLIYFSLARRRILVADYKRNILRLPLLQLHHLRHLILILVSWYTWLTL